MTAAIFTSNLKKSYGQKKVLKGISLTVDPGTICALLGTNGAGKTTMVRILTTQIVPDAGQAAIMGHDVVRDADHIHQIIGLTGQFSALDDALSGKENMFLIASLCHIPRASEKADAMLARMGLEEAGCHRVKTYSGGMKRRLDIAMSLMSDPQVLFLDEPTTGLDPGSRRQSWEAIRQLSASGTTVFLTTQYLEEAELLADQIAVLHEGKIITTGTPEQLKGRFSHEKLCFHFAHARFARQAAAILADFRPHSDAQTLELRVQRAETMTLLTHVLTRLHQAHIMPVRFEQARPSLEDAFLQMIEREREAHER
ncbi:MAG: ATP-binding cassette domain-containing protein [Merdibacter sp.]